MPVNHVLATHASGEIPHDVDEASAEHEVVRLREMLDGGPTGSTPLCAPVRRGFSATLPGLQGGTLPTRSRLPERRRFCGVRTIIL